MAKGKDAAQSKADTPQDLRDRAEAEARGEGDQIVLTNDSGDVKRLNAEEWEMQRVRLEAEGWKQLGSDEVK